MRGRGTARAWPHPQIQEGLRTALAAVVKRKATPPTQLACDAHFTVYSLSTFSSIRKLNTLRCTHSKSGSGAARGPRGPVRSDYTEILSARLTSVQDNSTESPREQKRARVLPEKNTQHRNTPLRKLVKPNKERDVYLQQRNSWSSVRSLRHKELEHERASRMETAHIPAERVRRLPLPLE